MIWLERKFIHSAKAKEPRGELAVWLPPQELKGRGCQFSQQEIQMLARHAHLVGKAAERERSRSALEPVVTILPVSRCP